MEIGTPCWCFDLKGTDDDFPDDFEADGVWRMAQITNKTENNKTFLLEAEYNDLSGIWKREYSVNLINNTDLEGCKLRNVEQGIEGGHIQPEVVVDDLITLPHLHEAAILHNLQARHASDIIYTMTGPILLAVNPFKRLGKEVYGPDIVERYHQAGIDAAKNGTTPSLPVEGDDTGNGPHVFLLADAAYRSMASCLPGSYSAPQEDQPINQSILVSGESGAGKTETTKFIMQYLATVAGTGSAGEGIQKKVLQSNPVLEAFGNARTIRNDNSSRFGKFIELHFHTRTSSETGKGRKGTRAIDTKQEGPMLVGAAVQTYLLEKVRLVAQQEGERNYHVFYELVAGASSSLRKSLRLPQCLDQEEEVEGGWLEEYRYVNQSACYERRDNVDDAEQFRHTAVAMKDIGLNKQSLGLTQEEEIEEKESEASVGFGEVLKVVAAILHLGNLTFESYVDQGSNSKGEGATAVDGPPPVKTRAATGQAASLLASTDQTEGGAASFALHMTASLLGVDPDGLSKALCSREIEVNGEKFTMVEDPRAASHARDGAAKVVYNDLFLWLVQRVNHSLSDIDASSPSQASQGKGRTSITSPPRAGGRGGRNKPTSGFIGVLDIFGFESFRTNSFEQLCINFANEKLQQQFNGFIFELEQQVYEQEEILWSMVDFPDNSACLELIERKHTGVLALLDEQCVLMSRSSDKGFASQLYEFHCKTNKHPNFRAGAAEMRGGLFIISHYAGEICYDTEGFLEKNVDKINPLVLELLMTSTSELVNTIAATAASASVAPTTASPMSASGAPLPGGSGRRGSKTSARALSVGSQFKGQLNDLLVKINETRPHFVRCIKPNDRNEATLWHGRRVLSQLRCGGVLEAVRVSRAGYPNRLSHDAFLARYRIIKPSLKGHSNKSSRTLALILLRSLLYDMFHKINGHVEDIDYDDIDKCIDRGDVGEKCKVLLGQVGLQLGRSKVFMRMVSFATLEHLRMKALRYAVVVIQSQVRKRLCMWKYKESLKALLLITKIYRGYKGRQVVMEISRNKVSTYIANFRRMLLARRSFLLAQRSSSLICRFRRCLVARRSLLLLKQSSSSRKLCNWWRQAIKTKQYNMLLKVTLYCQCKLRRNVAKKIVKELRMQAKNLDSVAAERDALKLKLQQMELMMASTQQGAHAMIQENETLKQKVILQKQMEEETVKNAIREVTVAPEQPDQSLRASTGTDEDSLNSEMGASLLNEQLMLQATAKAEEAERRVLELERKLSESMHRSDMVQTVPREIASSSPQNEKNSPTLTSSLIHEEEVEDMSDVFLDPEGEWCPNNATPLHVACAVGDVELVAEFLVVAAKSNIEILSPLSGGLSPQSPERKIRLDEDSDEEIESRFARLSSFSFSPLTCDGVPVHYDTEDTSPLLMWTTCLGHILTVHDADGRIALHAASQGGHDFIVKALVAAAASTTVEQVIELAETLVNETFAICEETEVDDDDVYEFPWEIVVAAAKSMAKTPTQREYAYLCSNRGLLGSAALCDVSDVRGDTSLHLCRSVDTASRLLENGANPNLINKDGQTPLHVAIRARNVKLVSRLLIGGADPHIAELTPSIGWSPVLLACSMPEALGLVKPFFTSTRVLDLSKTDRNNNTALHICCRYGGSLTLLAQEDSPKKSGSEGGVRKAWRGSQGQKEVGRRALRGRSSSRSDQVDEPKRISESVGRSRFRASSVTSDLKTTKRDSGDIEDRELGVLRTIQLLLSHGADPNAKNKYGMSPVHELVNNIFLRDLKGEKIQPQEEMSAARRVRRGVSDAPAYESPVRQAIPNMVSPCDDEMSSSSGSLVLHACAVTLLGSHADPCALDDFNSSPLLDAARVGDLGLCELLVRHGANLNHLQPRAQFEKALEWRKDANNELRSTLMLRKFKKTDLTTPIWQRLGAVGPIVDESSGGQDVSTMLQDPFQWLTSETSEHVGLTPYVTFYELCASQSFLKSVLRAVCTPPLMVPDNALKYCMGCQDTFSETKWRHHCRLCARLLCHSCSSRQSPASAFPSGFDTSLHPSDDKVLTVVRSSSRNERVCDACYAVLSLRFVKQQASKPTIAPSEDSNTVSPYKSASASSTPTRRMRRGSAPDGSSVFQSLSPGMSPDTKLVPPPRPPEDTKKVRSSFFKRTPSKKDKEEVDEEDIVRNFSMLDDASQDADIQASNENSGSPIAFPSFDDLTGALTSTTQTPMSSASSIFNRISESLTRITSRDDASDKKVKAAPKKRNLRDLMKSKKKSAPEASELDEEHRGGAQHQTNQAEEEPDDGFSWSSLTARSDDDEADR